MAEQPISEERRAAVSSRYRLTIFITIVISTLIIFFIAYITYNSQTMIGKGFVPFVLAFVSYAITAFFLIIFFTHRILSPITRLKELMEIPLKGDYKVRMKVRDNDPAIIRSFVDQINRLLADLHKKQLYNEEFARHIDEGVTGIVQIVEKEEFSADEVKDAVISFHEKLYTTMENMTAKKE